MTEFRHDPNSLADRLDQLLPPGQPDQIGSDGDPLIETAARLASAPRPSLSPVAMALIQARVMQSQPTPLRLPLSSSVRLALVAALTVIVFAGAVFAAHKMGFTLIAPNASRTPANTATPSATWTQTASPTETSAPTIEAPVIFLASPSPSLTPTQSPSPTVTETPTPSATPLLPTVTLSPMSLPATLIIEGPVQAIDGDIVVIYDIEVEVNPNDPILTIIQVGDPVRVEGILGTEGNEIIVIAVSVTTIDVEVNISPEGEVWRDTGDCSNPPPDWAPAYGWHTRCEGAPPHGNSGGMGMGDDDE